MCYYDTGFSEHSGISLRISLVSQKVIVKVGWDDDGLRSKLLDINNINYKYGQGNRYINGASSLSGPA